PVEVPPLRQRRSDIHLLVEYFVHRYAKRAGDKMDEISEYSRDLLRAYPWPGNIRELQNVIERAVIVSDTNTLSIDERWLVRQRVVESDAKKTLGGEVTAHGRSRVEAALAASKGRVSGPTGAAARLGVPR